MSKFLVTGGAGFIGSSIVERLMANGHHVRVLDNFYSGNKNNLEFINKYDRRKFELVVGDIRNVKLVDQSCRGIDVVFHHAALKSVPESLIKPESYNDVNIGGTLNLLKSCTKNKVRRFIFASSSAVYGDTDQFPQSESAPTPLISPYALSKLAGEFYCRIYSEHFELETVSLRYFNVFGPRQSLEDEYAVVIPKFIDCLMRGEQPPIFGTGKQSRDFVYIDNVVNANILAAKVKKIKHEVFNVGTGKDSSILELVLSLNKILGLSIKPKLLPKRSGDVFKTKSDISRIKRILGYSVKVGFDEGLSKTVQYFKRLN